MFLKKRSFFEKYDKILYLPIEVHLREFHAKLYLAYQASKRGWIVIIGPEYDVNKLAQFMPPGVYFGNGFHNKAKRISSVLKKSGHAIISQDEEGLVRWSSEIYKEYRINPQINNYIDCFLCWGESDKKIIQSAFKKTISVSPIGNLRFDILSPSLRKLFLENVNDIKKKNGDFVLINGNFGRTNHTNGEDYYVKDIKLRGWLDNPSKKEYQLRGIEFQKKIFQKMIELSIAIAQTGQKVVVRPHPSENIEVWKTKTRNYSKNIKIIRSGNVVPWLMASKLIIHNGCGTAIESLLLNKKVVSYRPFKNSEVETYLPNAVSFCLETKSEILNYLKDFSEDQSTEIKKETLDILESYVKKNNLDEDASIRIINLIEKLSPQKKNNLLNSYKNNLKIEISLFKSFISRNLHRKNFLYLKNKCPALDIKQVNSVLDFFSTSRRSQSKIKTLNLTKHSIIISDKIY